MKTRLISAIVLLLIFIPIVWLGGVYYIVFSSIVGLIGLWELLRVEENIPYYMKLISFINCLFLIVYSFLGINDIELFSLPILGGLFLFYSSSVIINNDLSKYNYKDSFYLMICVLIIGLLFNCFIRVRTMGLPFLIYVFVISISTDTFAFIGGNILGKKKLTSISPNKTIEGSISGSCMGTILGSIYSIYFIDNTNIPLIVLISFTLTILSQIGDLFFSSIKRYHGIKDFSNLIPGHGGILDRLDSVLFVIIGYLIYNMFI